MFEVQIFVHNAVFQLIQCYKKKNVTFVLTSSWGGNIISIIIIIIVLVVIIIKMLCIFYCPAQFWGIFWWSWKETRIDFSNVKTFSVLFKELLQFWRPGGESLSGHLCHLAGWYLWPSCWSHARASVSHSCMSCHETLRSVSESEDKGWKGRQEKDPILCHRGGRGSGGGAGCPVSRGLVVQSQLKPDLNAVVSLDKTLCLVYVFEWMFGGGLKCRLAARSPFAPG